MINFKPLREDEEEEDDENVSIKPNYIGAAAVNVINILLNVPSSARETLGTVMTQDLYAISASKAAEYVSLTVSLSVGIAAITALIVLRFTIKYDNRNVLILFGILILILSMGLRYPMSGDDIPLVNCTNIEKPSNAYMSFVQRVYYDRVSNQGELYKNVTTENTPTNTCHGYGCPQLEQPWCQYTKLITGPQIISMYCLSRVALGIGIPTLQSVYSKIFGKAPMGVWMSMISISASVSKIVSPLWLSYTYVRFGPVVVCMIMFSFAILAGILSIVFYKNMAPMDLTSLKVLKNNLSDKNISNVENNKENSGSTRTLPDNLPNITV